MPLRLKSSFYTVPSICVRVCASLQPPPIRSTLVRWSEATSLWSRRAYPQMSAIAVERWVNRKTGRHTDRRTCRQTDRRHKTGLWPRGTTTQRSIYNSLNMVQDHNVFICRKGLCNWHFIYRDTVAILDYQGTFLWSLCDVMMWILWRWVGKCFYFLSYTIQQDKNPLDTGQSFIQLKETKNKTLFPTAGRSKRQFEKKNKTKKQNLYQHLHNSSEWLGCKWL